MKLLLFVAAGIAVVVLIDRISRPRNSPPPPAQAEKTLDVPSPKMVSLPAGQYRIGSPANEVGRMEDEGPQRELSIAAFALSATPVTRGQFAAFVADTNYKAEGCHVWNGKEWRGDAKADWRSPGFDQDDTHPVVCVSWDDAQAYVKWLSQKTRQVYRLPTEAEWEYAARAGTTTARYWGEDEDVVCPYANVADQETKEKLARNPVWLNFVHCRDGWAYTAPADYGKANGFGLKGMLGNVWQWTEDCWHKNYMGRPSDGRAWMEESDGDCDRPALRGGGWLENPGNIRSAYRNPRAAGLRESDFGFRVARTLP